MKKQICLALMLFLGACKDPDASNSQGTFPEQNNTVNTPAENSLIPSQELSPSAGGSNTGLPSSSDARPPSSSDAIPPGSSNAIPPPMEDPAANLDCRYEVIRQNFRSDPRFPDIVNAVQEFEDYQNTMDPDELAAVVTEFTRIYVEFARPHKPCSKDYMGMFENTGKAEEYARRMCRQMELSQYFNDKFPCLKKLTDEQKMTLILE